MKITIELFHDELLPHQRGALAVLLNPVAPKPLVGGDVAVDVSELVPGSDDLDIDVDRGAGGTCSEDGADERVVGDRPVRAQIKRSEVVLRVGDKVRLRCGIAFEVTGVGITSVWGPGFTVDVGGIHVTARGRARLDSVDNFADVVEINGVPVVED